MSEGALEEQAQTQPDVELSVEEPVEEESPAEGQAPAGEPALEDYQRGVEGWMDVVFVGSSGPEQYSVKVPEYRTFMGED